MKRAEKSIKTETFGGVSIGRLATSSIGLYTLPQRYELGQQKGEHHRVESDSLMLIRYCQSQPSS